MKHPLIHWSTEKPKQLFWLTAILVIIALSQYPRINIDTDPENMLPAEHPARVLHNDIKQRFNLYDMIVVGIVNDQSEHGIFNPQSLGSIKSLSDSILGIEGVIAPELMSLSTVDNISQEGPGTIRFQWMMDKVPESISDSLAIKDAVSRLPMLDNTLVSEDGQAAAIYVPIREKHESYRIAGEIQAFIDTIQSEDEFHITGLPVAEDTFGVEMFIQMAISAPLAALFIFALMWWFFRSAALITAPMIVAMATVLIVMGALIGAGFTVHIMSSMIPIFLMPIAVVDSVHLLSEFSDRYRPGQSVRDTIEQVMDHLYKPMLFTSITSAVGFISLAFTPIPPVQIFGIFVAAGILLAFALTVTFVPAYVVSLSPKSLKKLAAKAQANTDTADSLLARTLRNSGPRAASKVKTIIALTSLIVGVSIYGVSQIQINDNPVRWFKANHEIRVADRVLNSHFAGTYNAFLVFNHDGSQVQKSFEQKSETLLGKASDTLRDAWQSWQTDAPFNEQLLSYYESLDLFLFEADGNDVAVAEELLELVESTQSQAKYFQDPANLKYVEALEAHLQQSDYIGKSNSLPLLIKTVYRELLGGEDEYFRLPDNAGAVAQTLLSFQSSHRPNDLWHFVTTDYNATSLWLQLKSGDNQDMLAVIQIAKDYVAANPLPDNVQLEWGGLTYINVVWQEAMVNGMLDSLLSAFVVVFVMMIVLFRSLLFGVLAMIPLSVTITFIYGLIGLVGKAYDMPIAVLSALTLGLSVDFAIHFLERFRESYRQAGDFTATVAIMFEEPARAISRNAIVIAMGFTPLLFAPLVPYQTVGVFLASIMVASCLATIILLPALLKVAHRFGANFGNPQRA